jgi:uncharacterized protein YjbI with pentapeptide repeats
MSDREGESQTRGRRLALLLGNGTYKDPRIGRLEKPAIDVRELARVLRQPEIGGFDEVVSLIEGEGREVTRAIARFFLDRSQDDLLLLYYSGHGRRWGDLLYLAVADTEWELPSATAISARFLHQEMERSWSRRQVLILDCCNSGFFERGAKGDEPPSSQELAEGFLGGVFPEEGRGRVVLAAASPDQQAWEGSSSGPSIFTRFLVQGLSTGEADLDGDGWISVEEIFKYASRLVREEQPGQTPQWSGHGQTGELILGRSPRGASRPEAARPAAGSPPGRKLRGNEIRGRNLRGEDLSGCELLDCDLSGTTLAGCKLIGARFFRAVSPAGAVDLEAADLRGATFEGCDLNGAILKDARLEDSRLLHTKLRSARLAGCRFDRARIESVDLALAQLHTASFRDATLEHLEFQPVVPIPFFRGVSLTRTSRAILRTVDVTGVAPGAFTEFCLLERRKDQMFEAAARLPVSIRWLRLAQLALSAAFGAVLHTVSSN